MKLRTLCHCFLGLLCLLAAGLPLQAESAAVAPADLPDFLATLQPETPPEVVPEPFLAASCTLSQCVAKCGTCPSPCVPVCNSTAFCICTCQQLNPRRLCTSTF
jgi:hypothetical protein